MIVARFQTQIHEYLIISVTVKDPYLNIFVIAHYLSLLLVKNLLTKDLTFRDLVLVFCLSSTIKIEAKLSVSRYVLNLYKRISIKMS